MSDAAVPGAAAGSFLDVRRDPCSLIRVPGPGTPHPRYHVTLAGGQSEFRIHRSTCPESEPQSVAE